MAILKTNFVNKNSPNIIFKCKYDLAINHKDNRFQNKDYSKERQKDVVDMIDYFSNPKESAMNMFDYYSGIISGKKYNLVLENGKYANSEDIKNLKKNYSKYIEKSNLWKGIISFNNSYIYENISLKTLEQKFAKEVMPQFLKYCGFDDIKNMSYVFAIHTKSKSRHIHIHFSFIENKPNYNYDNKKINYRKIGNINIKERNYLKRLMALTIEREKYYTPLLTKTNEDIDELKSYFKPNEKNYILNNTNEIIIEEKILKLGALLKDYRTINNNSSNRIKYNSIKNTNLGKEIKMLTKDIKNYLFHDQDSLLYGTKETIETDLKLINQYFEKINDDLHINQIVNDVSIVKKKEEYIDNYIYNAIVNHALYKYDKIFNTVKSKNKYNEITLDDLIQEIAYQNIKENIYDNDNKRRKQVLLNYFQNIDISSKFPSKYKMESALKKINLEMDQATEQFSKLFEYDHKKV